jgi:hypothetical protein
LHSNGFRVLREIEQRVDDAAVDTVAVQFQRCGEADRACACDEHLGIGGVEHPVIIAGRLAGAAAKSSGPQPVLRPS